MTISSNIAPSIPVLTYKELHAAKFAFDMPFIVKLHNDDYFYAEEVIRMVPKRRMVVFGIWQGKAVVVKIFFDHHHASRHLKKEVEGIENLQARKVPTPSVYFHGASQDKRMQVLILERILEVEDLEHVWRHRQDLETVLPILKNVVMEIATQHVVGVMQRDLHFKNFLLTEKSIYTLDGAQIEFFPFLLPKKNSMNNLALFLSQLGAGMEALQGELFAYYAQLRGWRLKSEDVDEWYAMIHQWNEQRWQKYEKKIFRRCTAFAKLSRWGARGMYDRSYMSPGLQAFFEQPDVIFQQPETLVLKAGRSSTVVKVTIDERDYVIKRYNLKNIFHRLRRCLRHTRARSGWRTSHKLNLFGVPTAKPIAFMEKYCLGFRGKSYFVIEYIKGEHLGEFFAKNFNDEEKVKEMVARVSQLLKSLSSIGMTHGDLKMTNVLIDRHKAPMLIDLDGAKEHFSQIGLVRAWRKEIKRFLENFYAYPTVCEHFKLAFNKE